MVFKVNIITFSFDRLKQIQKKLILHSDLKFAKFTSVW